VKISPAVLNSLLQAAEAGSAVLSLNDRLQTAGEDLSTSTVSPGLCPKSLPNHYIVHYIVTTPFCSGVRMFRDF